jgi:hypothetical protein
VITTRLSQDQAHDVLKYMARPEGTVYYRDDFFIVPVFYTDWLKIIEDILTKRPPYNVPIFDCDNMARWFKSRVDELGFTNGMGIAKEPGDPGHDWNVFLVPGLAMFLEPQTGKIWHEAPKPLEIEMY